MIFRFFLTLVAVAAVILGLAYYDYRGFLEQPVKLSDNNELFTIERGWSAKRVGEELASKQIISKPHWFYLHARVEKKAAAIKSGEFELSPGLNSESLLDLFIKGQSKQYSASIIEGHSFKQMRVALKNLKHLEQALDGVSNSELMAMLGKPDIHVEGQFFADTFSFPKGSSDKEFLLRATRALDATLQEEWENKAPDLPYKSPYEALIMASIIEKETAVSAERPLIAGVFVSRLRKRMRLQTDPTVIYGIGDAYDGNIRRSDLRRDTPYNTYTRSGLPPTPISMVGREAINAALNPDSTTSLYFVARGDGTHQFSETLEQHNAAVRKYQLKK